LTGKEECPMRRALLFWLLVCAGLPAQQVPQATDLPSHPFFIKNTWYIGGTGNWEYLTMDPQSDRLYIAHGISVQVEDVDAGTLAGEITGFDEARQVALDDTGEHGYISDGPRGKVTVFDRQTLKKVVEIDTGPNPRSMVFDPLTRLLFVVRANPPAEEVAAPAGRRRPGAREEPPAEHGIQSFVTVIDTQSQTVVGEIILTGTLGFAVEDENNQVYVSVTDRNQIFRFDAQVVAALLHVQPEGAPVPATESSSASVTEVSGAGNGPGTGPGTAKAAPPWVTLDWSGGHVPSAGEAHLRTFSLSPECADPASLAIDSAHMRVFAACNNRELVVVNAGNGEKVTTLPIGPGVDAVGYDQEHGLIFTANGGAEGSMTIIRQDVTDTYAVIQTLPTRQRASTLAVNPQTGAVYLVTDYHGVDLSHPGGIGTLEQTSVKGSFQVLQIAY